MKIALYVPSWPAGRSANGIVTYASYIVPALRELGHDVYVLTFNRQDVEIDPHTIDLSKINIKRNLLDRLLLKLLPSRYYHRDVGRRIVGALSALQRIERIDIFEVEESFGWALNVSRTLSIPTVIRLHGPWIINGATGEKSNFQFKERVRQEGRAIASATYVTAASSFVLNAVKTYYDFQLAKSRVVFNPIAIENQHWQLESCDLYSILYVGRFDYAKGADLVLRAFAILAKKFPKLRLTFVGPDRGIQEDGNALLQFGDYLTKYFSDERRERIDFRGQLPHVEVMKLRTAHFLTIVASRFEILPYSVIEAMALGCPIVASQVGGIPELITNGKNGLLFQPGNINELVQACSSLLEDHSYASDIGRQARADCELNLNPDRIARETILVYQEATCNELKI